MGDLDLHISLSDHSALRSNSKMEASLCAAACKDIALGFTTSSVRADEAWSEGRKSALPG